MRHDLFSLCCGLWSLPPPLSVCEPDLVGSSRLVLFLLWCWFSVPAASCFGGLVICGTVVFTEVQVYKLNLYTQTPGSLVLNVWMKCTSWGGKIIWSLKPYSHSGAQADKTWSRRHPVLPAGQLLPNCGGPGAVSGTPCRILYWDVGKFVVDV